MSAKSIFKCPKCRAEIEYHRGFVLRDTIMLLFISLFELICSSSYFNSLHVTEELKCSKCQTNTEIYIPLLLSIFYVLMLCAIFYTIYAMFDGLLRILGFVIGIPACCFIFYFVIINSLDIRLKSTKTWHNPKVAGSTLVLNEQVRHRGNSRSVPYGDRSCPR